MHKKYDIAVLGAINLNLAFKPVDAAMFRQDVTLAPQMGATPGGDAMNEAMAAACLGNRVALCGKVGQDLFGQSVLEQAQRFGVDISGVVAAPGEHTAIGVQLVSADGQRRIIAHRGAMESFCLNDVDFSVIENAAAVSIGSFFILKSLDGDGMSAVLARAKAAGAVTAADCMQDTYGIGFAGVKHCFAHLDYFLPSYDEARALSGMKKPADQADFFLAAGCRNTVIKLGRDGCFVACGDGTRQFIPECPGEPVDTTGAGDHFVAGFLTGILKGDEPAEAARLGSATAAISVQSMGSSGAIKSLEQVIAYRRQYGY